MGIMCGRRRKSLPMTLERREPLWSAAQCRWRARLRGRSTSGLYTMIAHKGGEGGDCQHQVGGSLSSLCLLIYFGFLIFKHVLFGFLFLLCSVVGRTDPPPGGKDMCAVILENELCRLLINIKKEFLFKPHAECEGRNGAMINVSRRLPKSVDRSIKGKKTFSHSFTLAASTICSA